MDILAGLIVLGITIWMVVVSIAQIGATCHSDRCATLEAGLALARSRGDIAATDQLEAALRDLRQG